MIGTIYTTRLLPSLDIIDELKGSKGRSVGHMYEMNIGQEMKGAHRAGTDVNGVVDILCDKRVTQKNTTNASAISLESWLEHSNHSKARLDWETKMKAEVEAENIMSLQASSIVVTGGGFTRDDDGEESDSSEECIAEEIISHVDGNTSRKYVVRWEA